MRTWIAVGRSVLHEPKLAGRLWYETYAWMALLLLADDEGVLRGITAEDLRNVMRFPGPAEDIEQALVYFERRRMIVRDGEVTTVVNWAKHQPPLRERGEKGRWSAARSPHGDHTAPHGDHTAATTPPTDRQTDRQTKEAGGEASSPLAASSHASCSFCTYLSDCWDDLEYPANRHDAWSAAFPAVDLLAAAKSARAWELANPTQKKHNHSKFLQNWFTREQDRGGNTQRTGFSGVNSSAEWGPGHPGWEKARENARQKAKGSAASTKAMLDAKLTVPATTEGERKAVLSRIHALKGNGAKK